MDFDEIFIEGQKWRMDQLIRLWQWTGLLINVKYKATENMEK